MSLLLLFGSGGPLSIASDTATGTWTGVQPTISGSGAVSRASGAATGTWVGVTPTIAGVVIIATPTATVTISGQTPTVVLGPPPVVVSTPTATITISGQTPTVFSIPPVVTPVDFAVITIQGQTPTVISAGPPVVVAVSAAVITVSGQTPSVQSRLPYTPPTPGVTIIGTGIPPESVVAEFEGSVIKVVRWLDIYEQDATTLWRASVGITAGSVSVDMGRDERRNIDVTIYDADGNIPYGPGGLWYDKVLKPYRGIQLANGDIYVFPLGEFLIDTVNRPHFPNTLQCSGRDFVKKLKLAKFTQTTSFASGTNIVDIIEAICVNGGITKLNFMAGSGSLSSIKSFDRGSERWSAAKGLAESINCELFFDVNGYLTLRPFVDPLTAPTTFTFNDTNLVDFNRSSNDSFLYNHVVVYGDSPDNPLVFGEAENNNSSSPTNITELGRRTYTRTSQYVVDNFQAEQIALSFLRVMGLEQFDMSITSLVIPWLEAGDAVEVNAPDASIVDPTRYLLSSFSIPLELGPMTGNAKRISIVG